MLRNNSDQNPPLLLLYRPDLRSALRLSVTCCTCRFWSRISVYNGQSSVGLVSSVESLYMRVEAESFPAFAEGGQKRPTQQDCRPGLEHGGGTSAGSYFGGLERKLAGCEAILSGTKTQTTLIVPDCISQIYLYERVPHPHLSLTNAEMQRKWFRVVLFFLSNIKG